MQVGSPIKLWEIANGKKSRLILALDFYEKTVICGKLDQKKKEEVFRKCVNLLERLKDLVVGVKIGFPLKFSIGMDNIAQLIESFKYNYYFIADFKLSDIPHVVEYILTALKEYGFDAAITQIFQGGLDEIKERKIDIFALVMMSHPQAVLFEKNFYFLVCEALKANIEGLVVGATKENFIKEVRKIVPNKTIISPGIITQGAKPAKALLLGSDFEIVGRAIIYSENPIESARRIVEAERNVVYK